MASWKIIQKPTEHNIEYIPFSRARKFFAVDASGSTGGAPLRSEQNFVEKIHQRSVEKENWITKWGSRCDNPVKDWRNFRWSSDKGGTQPSEILKNEHSLGRIHSSDLWFLLTDGEVYGSEVQDLATLGQAKGVFSCPTIFLITSRLTSSPNDADVSVGITSYANAQDALCLFKDYRTERIYVIAGKGCFAALDEGKDHDTWQGLTSFKNEPELLNKIEELEITLPTADTRETLPSGVNLGAEWDSAHEHPTYADLNALLQAGSVSDEDLKLLLNDEALDILSLACKTRGLLGEYRTFLQNQRVEQMTIQLEDVAGAASIIAQLGGSALSEEAKTDLQAKLRAAHTANRVYYLSALEGDDAGAAVRDRNRLVDQAMRNLAEIEKSNYTAEILSRRSNRARRAETVFKDSSVEVSTLDFDAPAFKGECEICCGEDEVMSVALKTLDTDAAAANTADFALDFPLAAGRFTANLNIISSQCICFQCALFGRPGMSIYAEPIAAVIPTLEYAGGNKQYINQQLYMALTGGLKTGVPILGQLFATILDRTLETKAWAGARADYAEEDIEVTKRQRSLEWVLGTVIKNLRCRETFNEQGKWCTYPEALAWAAKDFASEGLTSWAINYPMAGFNQILRFGTKMDVFSERVVRDMKAVKLIHSVVSAYLAELLRNQGKGTLWTQDLLSMVYAEFNSDLVPRDLGLENTLITSTDNFTKSLTGFLSAAPELFTDLDELDKAKLMPRIQVLIFWLVFFQRSHTSAKTYFLNIRTSEPLASAVLDPNAELPKHLIDEILLSPFLNAAQFVNKKLAASHQTALIPFKTPFGASLLACGDPNCSVSFVPPSLHGKKLTKVTWTPQLLDQVRQARAKHLVAVYGIKTRFEGNQTGLPEPTAMPTKPSSTHTTMHISIARTWARMSREERRAVVESPISGPALDAFVVAARKEICNTRRGDVFSADLDRHIRELVPSFLDALAGAVVLKAGDGKPGDGADVAGLELDFEENKVEWKVKYEIALDAGRRQG